MTESFEVDVWVRGTERAKTHHLSLSAADRWSDDDVRRLLSEMLLALEREKNPDGEPPPVALRGFSWIVNRAEQGGVLVHLEMQMGTASAGPFNIDEHKLTAMIRRVMAPAPSASVH
jgi:hypothetical protein